MRVIYIAMDQNVHSGLPEHYFTLTPWRPLLPYGYSYKASRARPD